MIKFYYNMSPNPSKVALFLEEAGLPYEAIPVDASLGDQFKPDYVAINPNSKVPAIVDGDVAVFDSNAILLYLADKTGQFLPPPAPDARARLYSWMMFVASGIGPYSGQAVHFNRFAPDLPYAKNRYTYEVERHYGVLEAQLARHRYVLGEIYTIVDMAAWGWARAVPFILGDAAWDKFPNVKRLVDEISARPAAGRVNALKDQHVFKPIDDSSRKYWFPQNERLAS